MKSIDGSTSYFDVFRQELYMIYMTTIQTSHLHGTHIPRNMIHRGFPPSLPSSNHVCIDVIQFNTIHDHSCTVYSYHTLQSYSHFTPIIIIIYYPWPTIFFAGGGAPRANPRASAEAGRSWSQRGGHKPTCPQKLLPPHCLGLLFQIIFEWHDI